MEYDKEIQFSPRFTNGNNEILLSEYNKIKSQKIADVLKKDKLNAKEQKKAKRRLRYLAQKDQIHLEYLQNKEKHKKRNSDYYSLSTIKEYHKKRYRTIKESRPWYQRLRQRAYQSNVSKHKNVEIDFDGDYILELFLKQHGLCAYYNIPLKIDGGDKHHPLKPSLDRIDNSKGYCKSNIVLCCLMANLSRNDMSHDDWIEFLKVFTITKKPPKEGGINCHGIPYGI